MRNKIYLRHRDKGKKQDLLKAIHFIEMIIERDYGKNKMEIILNSHGEWLKNNGYYKEAKECFKKAEN